jgi:DUF4097 and DUF4098 domain-containing protein YvlB
MTARIRFAAIGLAVLLAGAGVAFGADYQEEFSKTVSLKSGDVFSLENVNGDVTISTWKEAKAEIKALKIAERDPADLKEVEIVVEEQAGAVFVKAVWPKNSHNVRVHVDFDVKVPEGVRLKGVETVNGDVRVTGPYSAVKAETTNGTVEAVDTKGDLDVETTNGNIRVRAVEGRVRAETTNGSIDLDQVLGADGVEAETTNGGITLRLQDPDKANASLRAETTNGHITFDFPVTLKSMRKSPHVLDVELGRGGRSIVLTTTNGSITVTR